MMWELRCGDVVPGCAGVVRADTRDEVMSQAAAHAADAHGIADVDPETARTLADAIHRR